MSTAVGSGLHPPDRLSASEANALEDYVRRMRKDHPDDPETAVLSTMRDLEKKIAETPLLLPPGGDVGNPPPEAEQGAPGAS